MVAWLLAALVAVLLGGYAVLAAATHELTFGHFWTNVLVVVPIAGIGWLVAAFATRLQDAVDLDSARDDLATVVYRALEPAHVSVWISQDS